MCERIVIWLFVCFFLFFWGGGGEACDVTPCLSMESPDAMFEILPKQLRFVEQIRLVD